MERGRSARYRANENMKNPKGQISLLVAIVGAIGVLGASLFTSWATSNNRVGSIEKSVSVIEEREGNHFTELSKAIEKMDKKIDILIGANSAKKK